MRRRGLYRLVVFLAFVSCFTETQVCTAGFVHSWQLFSRRGFALAQTVSLLLPPQVAIAEETVKRLAAVESYPPFGSLLPLAGVFSLARSATQISDPEQLTSMSSRLGKLSNDDLDAYRFVCTQYISSIKYNDPDEKVIEFDKAGRFKACDDAIAALGRARDVLKSDQVEKTLFQREISSIGLNLAGFFALTPQADFDKALALSQRLRSMDMDKDNKLSQEEEGTIQSGVQPLEAEDIATISALRRLGLGGVLIP
mmetsp:Transcript_46043/g.85895  ORF Transcript_46043/g.85895 Transcript_46043/m.85895 type:complete len:255 (-) Transcript_46043:33-797(-)